MVVPASAALAPGGKQVFYRGELLGAWSKSMAINGNRFQDRFIGGKCLTGV